MAYSNWDTNYVMTVHGRWESAAEHARCISWAREFFAKTQPFASGVAYINFLTQDETDRIAFAYGASYNRQQPPFKHSRRPRQGIVGVFSLKGICLSSKTKPPGFPGGFAWLVKTATC